MKIYLVRFTREVLHKNIIVCCEDYSQIVTYVENVQTFEPNIVEEVERVGHSYISEFTYIVIIKK